MLITLCLCFNGYMNNQDVFIALELSEGQRVKLARVARGLRQVDIASQARCTVADVVCLEKDRYLPRMRKEKILEVLGLLDNENKRD